MKKLIILLCFLTAYTCSQIDTSKWTITTDRFGVYNTVVNKVTMFGFTAGSLKLPIQLITDYTMSQNVAEFPIIFSDTSAAVVDTVSRHVISASNTLADTTYEYQITFFVMDSLYISDTPAMTNKFLIMPGKYDLPSWFTADMPNWYYKSYDTDVCTLQVLIKCRGKQ